MTKKSKYLFMYHISHSPAFVPIAYGIFGWFWIIFSDNFVNYYFKENVALIQTYKGWAYVVITAFLLYGLIRLQNFYIFQKEREANYSRSQRNLLLNTLENSSFGIVILDEQKHPIYINSTFKKIFKIEEDEKKFSIPKIINESFKFCENKDTFSFEKEVLRADGSFFNAHIVINCHKNEEELFFTCMILDISEQIKIKTELKEKEEMMIFQSRHAAMGEMISMIAHQWRQPLSVISMESSNLLMDSTFDTLKHEIVEKKVHGIQNQLSYLSNTIDDFRNFFKPDNKKTTLLLSILLKNTLSIINTYLKQQNINVKMNIEKDTEITTYSRELSQVLINLLKNASDAFERDLELKDKNIVITINNDDNNAFLMIKDNAGGIEKDILPDIFTPYVSTKSKKNGTGLGLHIAKTIIEKHILGTITASNQDGGALFIIKLPINK